METCKNKVAMLNTRLNNLGRERNKEQHKREVMDMNSRKKEKNENMSCRPPIQISINKPATRDFSNHSLESQQGLQQ
jgi:hypothetical protein